MSQLKFNRREDFVYWFTRVHRAGKNIYPFTITIQDGKTDVIEISSVGRTAPTPTSDKPV